MRAKEERDEQSEKKNHVHIRKQSSREYSQPTYCIVHRIKQDSEFPVARRNDGSPHILLRKTLIHTLHTLRTNVLYTIQITNRVRSMSAFLRAARAQHTTSYLPFAHIALMICTHAPTSTDQPTDRRGWWFFIHDSRCATTNNMCAHNKCSRSLHDDDGDRLGGTQ